jgi:hypothetical protein
MVSRLLLTSGALVCVAACLTAASCSSGPAQDGATKNSQSGGGVGGGGGAGIGGGVGVVVAGGSSGTAGAGAMSGGGGAAAGGGGAASGAGGSGGGSGDGPTGRHAGMKSAGCGKAVMGAVEDAFTNHRISIPACAACAVPDCPSNCIAPPFVPGGVNAATAPDGETFLDRDYTIELPAGYDPNHAYPVFYGADGCGPAPPLRGAAFRVPGEDGSIKVGLQQITPCFADGGIRCSPDIKNVGTCLNGPELPYMLAVMSWVEANFCVDLGTEFIGGGSSGAWQALLAGCAAANMFRGAYSLAGGLREHRWACNGPIASFMIVSDADTSNPVGPLAQLKVDEDTYGMAPARDEILKRNGCNGSARMPYDPKYPECVTYTGCPAAYPVVWCEFPSGSHDNPTYNNINYLNAVAQFLLGLPSAP